MIWTQVAEQNKDVQLTDFVESEFLAEQVKFMFLTSISFGSLFSPIENRKRKLLYKSVCTIIFLWTL